MRRSLRLALLALLLAGAAAADEPPRASTEVLVRSTTSWDGGAFRYPDGQPEITVTRITIPAGVTLPMHCHPVPLAGALTRGRLEVRKASGETVLVGAGEGLIEVSGQWHQGHALEDTEILVVYAGAESVPLTVLADDGEGLSGACGISGEPGPA